MPNSKDKAEILWAVPSLIIDIHQLTYLEPSIIEADLYAVIKKKEISDEPVPVMIEFGDVSGTALQVKRVYDIEPLRTPVTLLATDQSGVIIPYVQPAIVENKVSASDHVCGAETILGEVICWVVDALRTSQNKINSEGLPIGDALLTLSALSIIEWEVRELAQLLDNLYLFTSRSIIEGALGMRNNKVVIPKKTLRAEHGLGELLRKIAEIKEDLIMAGQGITNQEYLKLIKKLHSVLTAHINKRDAKEVDLSELFPGLGCLNDLAKLSGAALGEEGSRYIKELYVFAPSIGSSTIVTDLAILLAKLSGAEYPARARPAVTILHTSHQASRRTAEALAKKLQSLGDRADLRNIEAEVSGGGLKGERIGRGLAELISKREESALVFVGEVPKDVLVAFAESITQAPGKGGPARRVFVAVPKKPPRTTLPVEGCRIDTAVGRVVECGLFRIKVEKAAPSPTIRIVDVTQRTSGGYYCVVPLTYAS